MDYTSPDFLQKEVARGQTPNFSEAVRIYDKLALSNKSATYREKTTGTLRRYGERPLCALKVTDVQRQHVVAIFTPLMRDGKDATAQMVWEAVSNRETSWGTTRVFISLRTGVTSLGKIHCNL
ncbi:hypothetical protein OA007_03340 [SAR116 cluster bacterium]|nr:hypothetical protein [SAR116 cluster bacterium]